MKTTKTLLIASGILVLSLTGPRVLSAQRLHGFLTPGVHSDLNDQSFAGIGGGALFDLMGSRISVGGQADLFISQGYFAGRVGPVGQFNVLRRGIVRPFAIGGFAWGESSGPMLGGGLELRPRGRIGFRVSVQDYFARVGGYRGTPDTTAHQVSVQAGISWR